MIFGLPAASGSAPERPRGRPEASRERLGVVLGRLGASWKRLEGVLERLGAILDRLGGVLGRLEASWKRLGGVLGPSWRDLEGLTPRDLNQPPPLTCQNRLPPSWNLPPGRPGT